MYIDISITISLTVECPSPNSLLIVRYSTMVASLQTVTATLGKYENINYMTVIQARVNSILNLYPGDLAMVEGQPGGKLAQNGKLGHSCASDEQ